MKNNIRLDEKLIFEDKETISKITTGDIVIKLIDNNKSILEIGNIKYIILKNLIGFKEKCLRYFLELKYIV